MDVKEEVDEHHADDSSRVDGSDSKSPVASSSAAQEAAIEKVGHRVYVGNLSWDTRWQGLKDHMREAGEVVHAEVFKESTGRSAGCGLVEYERSSDAINAIKTMNDSMLDGRAIFVREDREEGKPRREARDKVQRRPEAGRKIVVWNLPYNIRWQHLKDMFRESGDVIRADVPLHHDGKSKGMGTVLFESERDAERAIRDWNGKSVEGRMIDCRLDKFAQ